MKIVLIFNKNNSETLENTCLNRFNDCLEIKDMNTHKLLYVIPYTSVSIIKYLDTYVLIRLYNMDGVSR